MLDKVLRKMEDTFADLISEEIDSSEFCKKFAQELSALPLENGTKQFDVNIVNRKHVEPFFGFRVFPVMDQMDKFTNEMVNQKISYRDLCKKWKSIPKWYIEIDAQVFDHSEITFNPKELVAMTLHEIGHVVYSEKPIEYFYRAYTDTKNRIALTDRGSLKILYSLYTIPLSIACMQRNWSNNKNELSVEFFADSYLKKFGYSEALLSAINKIIRAYGSFESESTKVNNIATNINWCNVNVVDLERRKRNLKDDLFQKSVRSSSPFFKGLCIKELQRLGARLKERYTGNVVDITMEAVGPEMYQSYESIYDPKTFANLAVNYKAVMESYRNTIATEAAKLEIPKQSRIDELAVEADRLTNHSDRIHVLDRIYRESLRLEKFRNAMELDDSLKSRYGSRIGRMEKQLEETRQRVLSKHSFSNEYKFFVKYPNGYEG